MPANPLFLTTAIEAVVRAGDMQMAHVGRHMQIDKKGTIDLVTLLQTQQTLFTAEDNLALVRLARMQAILSLFQALGGSWLPPGVGANANVMQ